ncbi:MAG: fibronectin type III domain-containing protein [Paraprevotella sp.]|nr:fibronectin type III domain-containing protein [Paraprevotella sp.]
MTSCSDDDVVKTQLDAPTVSAGYKTVSCLSFNWDPVEGATQYAYELRDPEGTLVNGDVTTTTSVLATGLKPNTTYTMTVWAYAAVTGNKSTSPIATITATTNEVIPLASPTPTAAPGNGGITIVWPEVEHATAYIVSYENNGENISITTTTNSVVLTDLSTGEHTVYIQAISNDENYCNSEIVAVTFIRDKQEIDRKELSYESEGLNMNFTGYLVTYDDGSYAIE